MTAWSPSRAHHDQTHRPFQGPQARATPKASQAGKWHIDAGTYKAAVGKAAGALDLTAETTLAEALFGS